MTCRVKLRPQTETDFEFLRRLYVSTREQELAHVGWTDEFKQSFLDSQFAAQWKHYSNHYFDAEFLIVERDGRPIGRLYLWRGENDIRIVDISLIAEERGRGLGGALLSDVLAEASRSGKSASIHVERFNPALRLYQRLGFEHVEDTGVYFLMKWTPQRTTPMDTMETARLAEDRLVNVPVVRPPDRNDEDVERLPGILGNEPVNLLPEQTIERPAEEK